MIALSALVRKDVRRVGNSRDAAKELGQHLDSVSRRSLFVSLTHCLLVSFINPAKYRALEKEFRKKVGLDKDED